MNKSTEQVLSSSLRSFCLWLNTLLLPTALNDFNNQHPLVISFDPLSVAGEMKLRLHSLPVTMGAAYAKYGLMWGLFTEMCYSHQTALVKTLNVVLLLRRPGDSEHQADMACISSSVSSFSSPLPGRPPPPPLHPHLFFLAGPTQVFLYLSHHSTTNPLCRSSIYPKPFGVLSVRHLSTLCPNSVGLSATRLTTHEITEMCGTRCFSSV